MPPARISAENYRRVLRSLNVGSPIAEDDGLLSDSRWRIETAVFQQLLSDEIDIVRGTKGSGKTALYRVFADFLPDTLLFGGFGRPKTAVLKGIEVTGDSVFRKFNDQFAQLTEVAFQNFWRIYLISLINSQLIEGQRFATALAPAKKELKKYRQLATKLGFPLGRAKK
jgi:hypothetical protein